MLCPDATTSAVHRVALKSDAARLTALTNVFSWRPARGIVNRITRELGPIHAAAPGFPLASSAISPLRAKAESLGSGACSRARATRLPPAPLVLFHMKTGQLQRSSSFVADRVARRACARPWTSWCSG
jgi:NAD(P)H-dependent flavin oxidoreductase YrpB (nitropropane dioxygenase family)